MNIDKKRREIEDDEQASVLSRWSENPERNNCCAAMIFLVLNGIFWFKTAMEIFA